MLASFNAFSIASGDFNGDGRPDIAVGASAGGGIAVALNDGTGALARLRFTLYLQCLRHHDRRFQQRWQTGHCRSESSHHWQRRCVARNGHWQLWLSDCYVIGGPSAKYLATGNFNGDNLDVAVSNAPINGTGNIAILLGNGMGSFTLSSVTACNRIHASADFNRDGKMDVLGIGSPLRLYFGDGMGGLSAPQTIDASSILDFTIADFNHDNNPDIAGMNGPSTVLNVSVLLGNGNGTFSPETVYPAGGHSGSFIENGDVNGDGHLDLVVTRLIPIRAWLEKSLCCWNRHGYIRAKDHLSRLAHSNNHTK